MSFFRDISRGIGATLFGREGSDIGNYRRQMDARRKDYLNQYDDLATPYPGYYTGVTGKGANVSLDPRFTVSGRGLESSFKDVLDNILGGYKRSEGIRDSALEDYNRASQSQSATAQAQSMAGGRGLRSSDAAALEQQRQSNALRGSQQIRQQFELRDAANRAGYGLEQGRLVAGLPQEFEAASAIRRANADRLLNELTSLNAYNQRAYQADMKEKMGRELGGVV